MKMTLMFSLILISSNALATPWNCETKSRAKLIDIKDNGTAMENNYTMYYLAETQSGKCSEFIAAANADRTPTSFKGFLYQVCDNSITGLGSFEAVNCWQ